MDMSYEESVETSSDDILESSYQEQNVTYRKASFLNHLTPVKQTTFKYTSYYSPMNVDTPGKENNFPATSFIGSRNDTKASSNFYENKYDVIEISDDSELDNSIARYNKTHALNASNCMEVESPIRSPLVQKLSNFILSERNKEAIRKVFNFDDDDCTEVQSSFKPNVCTWSAPQISTSVTNLSGTSKSNQEDAGDRTSVKKTNCLPTKNEVTLNGGELQLSFLSSLSEKVHGMPCDPVATFFKTHFKTARISLAQHLYYIFNETVFDNKLPKGMPLKWTKQLQTSSGITTTKYEADPEGVKKPVAYITLSKSILNNAERLRNTMIHEMCHAATWLINRSRESHGPIWKSWAYKARLTFPELPKVTRCHDYKIDYRYLYKCADCGYSIGRSRPSEKILIRSSCGYCGGRFKLQEGRT